MTTIAIGDYLDLVSLKDNPYQRNILSSTFYKKLIDDLLHDTTMPPISIVWMGNNFNLKNFNEPK